MSMHVHGGDIYHYDKCVDFSTNCNPLGTPEGIKEAVRSCLDQLHNYPEVGYEPLKKAIGDYEGVDPSWVICGNGAAELIFSICRAQKPRRALVTAPTFAEYEQALESVGCQVEHFFLAEEDGFRVGREFLDRLDERPDMVFLCNPNNPTGILMDRGFLMKILEKCADSGILLVVDECFLDFVEEPEKYTLKSALHSCGKLFLLKAFTKRYAMAGLRLGYGLCSDPSLLERMTAQNQPWNISTVAQAAGLAALKETDYVEAGRQLIFREAGYLKEGLSNLGLLVFPSETNYIFFKGPTNLFEACVGKNVLIRDCSNYPGLAKGYYRIAVRTHGENERLLQALEEILHKSLG